ncbi:kinase [Amycolatopsis sp. WAC 01375]|uniref:ATP-binding protein n=1 Tax=Amycolatopsis sp. WAC 01375 TaxID=2203194 RepID=UPI000F77C8C8|nr:ATP-binding protein [Amycolatopsis sp. WAC 01375]RSM68706.1 kinase [Amycolatopsis sp. WAC 01375]
MGRHRSTAPQPIGTSNGLTVMIGAPGAGKTYFLTREFEAGRIDNVLSLDAARGEFGVGPHDQSVTAQAVAYVVEQAGILLAAGADVTIDATSTTVSDRRTWLALARSHCVPARAVIVRTPLTVALSRNSRRPHPVPSTFLRECHRRVANLTTGALLAEGFAAVSELDIHLGRE